MRDIDMIIEKVRLRMPEVEVYQLDPTAPGVASSDDGLWYFYLPGVSKEVHIESPDGCCPFIYENSINSGYDALTVETAEAAVDAICDYLASVN